MFKFQRFKAVFLARNREFFRDKGSVIWNLAFPILLIFGLSVMFSDGGRDQLRAGLVFGANDALAKRSTDIRHVSDNKATHIPKQALPEALKSLQYIRFVRYQSVALAELKVQQHQIDILIDWDNQTYYVNDSSPKGYFAESSLNSQVQGLEKHVLSGEPVKYVDWVMPGVLGMNMMFSCLFGVGYVIVRYRKSGVLKRMQATPITAFEFILAQVMSRFSIVLVISSGLFVACWKILGLKMNGSLFDLIVLIGLGALSLVSLGLMAAAKMKSEELMGGLLNLATWPMMLLSGVWFSLEGAPDFVKWIAEALPLTHFVEGARAVMIDGASLADVSYNVAVLCVMICTFLAAASFLFDWGRQR
jgi:ABC-2 type transport system permease protein